MRFALLAAVDAVVYEVLEEGDEAAQIDDDGRYQVGDLGAVHSLVDVCAAVRDVLYEVGGEDVADGVQTAEEGGGDAVEAHGRHGGLAALPLLKSGEEQQRRAETCERARDDHREDDISLLVHAAVFRGVFIAAGRAQLVAELGLLEENPDEYGHEDSYRQRDRDILVVAEELSEAEARYQRGGIGAGKSEGVGAGGLLDGREDHVDNIEAYPVEHDAGDDLVDVAVGFQRAGDCAEYRAGEHCADDADVPRLIQRQRQIQCRARAGDVLAGGTDIEQADLIREQNGQTAQHQRHGFHQRAAEILERGGLAGVIEKVLDNGEYRVPRAGGIDEQQDYVADQQADDDTCEGCEQRLHRAVFHNTLHAFLPSLFAPAMYRPSSSTVVFFGSSSPTISPSYMTRIRSETFMTSSSSSETSNTAPPASRVATSCR